MQQNYDNRIPVARKERKDAFIILLYNLEEYGYDKESIDISRKEKIIRQCVNVNYNKKKLKIWVTMALRDLEQAMLTYYNSVVIKRDPNNAELEAKLAELENKK